MKAWLRVCCWVLGVGVGIQSKLPASFPFPLLPSHDGSFDVWNYWNLWPVGGVSMERCFVSIEVWAPQEGHRESRRASGFQWHRSRRGCEDPEEWG